MAAPTPVSVKDTSPTPKIPNDWTLYRSNRRGGSSGIDPKRYEKVKTDVDKLWKETKTAVEKRHADASDVRIDLTGRIRFKAGGQDHCIDRQVLGENPEETKLLLKEIKKVGAMVANELGEEIDTDTYSSINTIAAASSRWDSFRDVSNYGEFKNTKLGHNFTTKFSGKSNWSEIESRLEQTDAFIVNRREKVQEKINETKEEIKSEKDKKKKDELKKKLENLREIRSELDGLKGPQKIAIYWAIAESLGEMPGHELPTNKDLNTNDLPRLKRTISEDLRNSLSQTLPVKDTRSLPTQKLGFKKPKPDPDQQVDTAISYFAQDAAELLSNGRSTAHFVVQNMTRLMEKDDEISSACRGLGFDEVLRDGLNDARNIMREKDAMAGAKEQEKAERIRHEEVEAFKQEIVTRHEDLQNLIDLMEEDPAKEMFNDISRNTLAWLEDETSQVEKITDKATQDERLRTLKFVKSDMDEWINEYNTAADLAGRRAALKKGVTSLYNYFTSLLPPMT